jgi:hypothetical protein
VEFKLISLASWAKYAGTPEKRRHAALELGGDLKKGPNIASVDPQTKQIVALYHPRTQRSGRTLPVDRRADFDCRNFI